VVWIESLTQEKMKMTRRRMTLMCFLVLVGVSGAADAMAEDNLVYFCDTPPTVSLCVRSTLSSASTPITIPSAIDFSGVSGSPFLVVSADRANAYVNTPCSTGNGVCQFRVALDGSGSEELNYDFVPKVNSGLGIFSAIPNLTSLSPTNQTITVFLLGMIASALIMRGKAVKEV
jgi:hypothetical protein